jgi:hypothetical protein
MVTPGKTPPASSITRPMISPAAASVVADICARLGGGGGGAGRPASRACLTGITLPAIGLAENCPGRNTSHSSKATGMSTVASTIWASPLMARG